MSTDDELAGLIDGALRMDGRTPSDARRLALRRAVAARAASTADSAAGLGAAADEGANVLDSGSPRQGPDGDRSGVRKRWFGRRDLVVGAAAAVVGAAVGVGVTRGDDSSPAPAAVPTEPLTMEVRQSAATASGRLINHTWGTELLLDVAGLTPGRVHDVVYAVADGGAGADSGEVQAGSFLSVPDVVMHCRFNAATLRADLAGISVRDRTSGETVIDTRLT